MKYKKIYPVMFPETPFGKMIHDPIISDPFGSYTGVPVETGDRPVQDADDL